MACTIRIAADTARLGQPEINLGIVPGYAGSQRLPRLVGKGIALEILLTGDMITAERAAQIGLVNRVVPAADVLAEAKKLAATLASKAPIASRYILELVHEGAEMPFDQAQFLETALFGAIASTEDTKEGTRAFLDKRKPEWKGQ
jgi:enoyl-CoA hydratase